MSSEKKQKDKKTFRQVASLIVVVLTFPLVMAVSLAIWCIMRATMRGAEYNMFDDDGELL